MKKLSQLHGKKKVVVTFGKKAEGQLAKIKHGNTRLYSFVLRAKADLTVDPYCGRKSTRYKSDRRFKHLGNLWKYNLPGGSRLMYTIGKTDNVVIMAIILEFGKHDLYRRLIHF